MRILIGKLFSFIKPRQQTITKLPKNVKRKFNFNLKLNQTYFSNTFPAPKYLIPSYRLHSSSHFSTFNKKINTTVNTSMTTEIDINYLERSFVANLQLMPATEKLIGHRTREWIQYASMFDDIKPSLIKAISKAHTSIYYLEASGKKATTLSLDLAIINETLKNISQSNTAMIPDKFSAHVQGLINQHATTIRFLKSPLESSSNLSQYLQDFDSGLKEVADSFSKVVNTASSVISIADKVKTLLSKVDNFNIGSDEVGKILDKLLKEASNAINVQKQIGEIKKAIESLKLEDQPVIKEKKKELENLLNKHKELSKNLQTISQGFELVGLFAKITGDMKLAQQITVIGQATVTIYSTIASWGAIAAMSGPLAPFVAIGGAIHTILQLFAGPNEVEMMTKEIKKYIIALAEHIDKRFDIIQGMIGNLEKEMLIGFQRTEKMLGIIYKNMMEGFILLSHDIKKDMHSLTILCNQISGQIAALNTKFDAYFQEMYKASYIQKKSGALKYHQQFTYPKYIMSQEKMTEYYQCFFDWAIYNSKNIILSGDPHSNLDRSALLNEIMTQGIEYKINNFASYLVKQYGLDNPGILANPIIWADTSLTFINFLKKTPEFTIEPQHLYGIIDIMDVGMQFNNFINDMKMNKKFFSALLAKYHSAFNAVEASLYDCLLTIPQSNNIDRNVILNKIEEIYEKYKKAILRDLLSSDWPPNKEIIKYLESKNFNTIELKSLIEMPNRNIEQSEKLCQLLNNLENLLSASPYKKMNFMEIVSNSLHFLKWMLDMRKFGETLAPYPVWYALLNNGIILDLGMNNKPNITFQNLIKLKSIIKEIDDAIKEKRRPHSLVSQFFGSNINSPGVLKLNNQIRSSMPSSTSLQKALFALDNTYQEVIICLSFAFYEDFMDSDSILSFNIKENLFNSREVLTQEKMLKEDQNILAVFLLPKALNYTFYGWEEPSTVSFFEKCFIEMQDTIIAKYTIKNNRSGYSIVDNVLDELSLFRQIYAEQVKTKFTLRKEESHDYTPMWKKTTSISKTINQFHLPLKRSTATSKR